MEHYRFPKGFLWGASTSAHQVEGGQNNDWTEWERENAERLANEAARQYSSLPSWESIKPLAIDPENYISGKAADSYNRYQEDIALLKEMGLNSYRFSIEWSRVEPRPNVFDEMAIQHYKDMVNELRKADIEPIVTLWHWTLPTWVRDLGGWRSPKTVRHFRKYAVRVVSELSEVQIWTTLNEPEIYAEASFLYANWPPQQKSLLGFWRVYHNLASAHITVYRAIKRMHPAAQVGISTDVVAYDGKSIFSRLVALISRTWINHFFLVRVQRHQDYIGLNYYFHNPSRRFKATQDLGRKFSDLGWELYPQGLFTVLKELSVYKKPIYITESGLADARDAQRADYIDSCLHQMNRAISDGIDVRGYLHWSLIDNFEWDKGFWPKFGLAEVDRKTMKRTLRPSAYHYAEIVKEHGNRV